MAAPRCTHCRSPHVVPIVYGLTDPELFASARDGHVALGGCVIDETSPEWSCRACGHRFNGDDDGPTQF